MEDSTTVNAEVKTVMAGNWRSSHQKNSVTFPSALFRWICFKSFVFQGKNSAT